jgi:uncharacterized membrane protein YphA (DoxX/SURF4 family)
MTTTSARSLTALRISVGCLFLIFAEYKVFGMQFTRGGGFQYWINLFLQGGAYPFMVPVLKNFVLPHATLIAFLVAYGELAIGLSLVFGILARPASVCGMIYMLVLLFSSNYPGSHAPGVAILRSFSRPFGVGAMLWRVRIDQSARTLVNRFPAATLPAARQSWPLKRASLVRASRRTRKPSRK